MATTDKTASEILAAIEPQKKPDHHEITSAHVKHLAGQGLHDPAVLSAAEVRELCGSVLAHIARHE